MARFIIRNKILENAFGLEEEIVLPDGIKDIKKYAFVGCPNLKSVKTTGSEDDVFMYDGVIYSGDGKKIILIPQGQTIINIPENLHPIAIERTEFVIGAVFPENWKYAGMVTRRMLRHLVSAECRGIQINLQSEKNLSFLADLLNMLTAGKEMTLDFLNTPVPRAVKDPIIIQLCRSGDKNSIVYLKKNFLRFAEDTVCNDDMDMLEEYDKFGCYTKQNTGTLIEYALERKKYQEALFFLIKKDEKGGFSLEETDRYFSMSEENSELTARILEYRNKYFSAELIDRIETDKMEKELGLKERSLTDWRKIFSFEECEEEIKITRYKGFDKDVTIPDTICGKPVTSIGDMAFSPEKSGTRRTLEKRLREIRSVYAGENLVSLGDKVFDGCENIEILCMPQVSSREFFKKPFITQKLVLKDEERDFSENDCREMIRKAKINDVINFAGTKWIVLKKESGRALVISEECLFKLELQRNNPYVSWEDSEIRTWLNDVFYDVFFTDEEKKMISESELLSEGRNNVIVSDKVFILSRSEAKGYFHSDEERKTNSGWWLRTPSYYGKYVWEVLSDGRLVDYGYPEFETGIRPAMELRYEV
ncbi:MAG: DUF6273 domain-containing protein [Oscillospiraceae bacterium]|nr:DUF6273 domain-containing protein [Oscillospiraceae bacterium]